MSSSLTFKLCFQTEIRRFTVDPSSSPSSFSFSSLHSTATEISHLPALRLTWHDNEGDVITIRNQGDLDEALSFLVSSGINTMKIFIEPENNNNNSSSSSTAAAPPYSSSSTAYFPHGNSEKVRLLEDVAAPGYDDHNNNNNNQKVAQMDPKLRQKLEKMDKKLGEEYQQCEKKLEKLRESPHFDEKEHARQVQVLRDAEIDVCPALSFAVAKRIIEQNKEKQQEQEQQEKEREGGRGEKCCCWGGRRRRRNWVARWVIDVVEGKGNWIPDDRKVATLSEKTQRQVKVLRENEMSCGWPIIMGLEFLNLQSASRVSDVEIQEQYNQVRGDLKHLPEPLVIWMLKIEAEERKEREAKEQEKQERKERWCQKRKEIREAKAERRERWCQRRKSHCWWGGAAEQTACCQ